MPVLRAIAHGMIDAYLPAPGAGRDEGFHRGISELLEEWAYEAAPALPAVWIIDRQQSARAHELRDVLSRNSRRGRRRGRAGRAVGRGVRGQRRSVYAAA
jgi:hypothetical protein